VSVWPTKQMKRSLGEKGFRQDNTHHEMFWLYVGGRRTSIRTRISHGAKEYNDSLLAMVAKQVRLRRADLDDLIECSLTGEDYLKLLTEQGHVKL